MSQVQSPDGLLARLEGAVATGIIMEREAVALQAALGLEDPHDTDWKQCCWNALKGSVDAALAIADEVLEKRGPINVNICLAGSAQVVIDGPGACDMPLAQVVASTPALALCAALLRATGQTPASKIGGVE